MGEVRMVLVLNASCSDGPNINAFNLNNHERKLGLFNIGALEHHL